MSKAVKRRCPQCGKVKLFRADQKTCGCPRPVGANAHKDALVGKYFVGRKGQADGKIIARVSGSQYLVRLGGDEGDVEQLAPIAFMGLWLFGDRTWYATQMALREMEDSES
jgi:hypothetical protein